MLQNVHLSLQNKQMWLFCKFFVLIGAHYNWSIRTHKWNWQRWNRNLCGSLNDTFLPTDQKTKIFSFWRYFKTKQNSSLHIQSVVRGIEAEGTRGEGEAAASALKDSNCM